MTRNGNSDLIAIYYQECWLQTLEWMTRLPADTPKSEMEKAKADVDRYYKLYQARLELEGEKCET